MSSDLQIDLILCSGIESELLRTLVVHYSSSLGSIRNLEAAFWLLCRLKLAWDLMAEDKIMCASISAVLRFIAIVI